MQTVAMHPPQCPFLWIEYVGHNTPRWPLHGLRDHIGAELFLRFLFAGVPHLFEVPGRLIFNERLYHRARPGCGLGVIKCSLLLVRVLSGGVAGARRAFQLGPRALAYGRSSTRWRRGGGFRTRLGADLRALFLGRRRHGARLPAPSPQAPGRDAC
eukprot:2485791-Prymnesium_polylepis.1